MPKSPEQKKKILLILQYLMDNSDEEHPVTTAKLLEYLEGCGVQAERKSIYSDIEYLIAMGYDIINRRGANGGYYVASRDFETAELKLLVDAVQSSKFITDKKTQELIIKIEKLTSHHEARKLHRQVFVANRVKADNESVLYSVDGIHEAISGNCRISFLYSEWSLKRKLEYRNNGERYIVDPLALVWDDENYYLVAGDVAKGIVKHFRVDKISDIRSEEVRRDSRWGAFDIAQYSKEHFGMFNGVKEKVTVRFRNNLVGVVIDRFGKNVFIIPKNEDEFEAVLNVQVSNQFFGWITGFAGDAWIVSPQTVIDKYKQVIEDISVKQWQN